MWEFPHFKMAFQSYIHFKFKTLKETGSYRSDSFTEIVRVPTNYVSLRSFWGLKESFTMKFVCQ